MTTTTTSAERQDTRFRRALRVGIVASVLLHVAIFLFVRSDRIPPSPFSAAGPDANDALAASGGGLEAVTLRIAEPQPIPRPPEPIIVPDVVIAVEDQPRPVLEPVELGGSTPGRGEPALTPGAGGTADGEGDGGTGETGLSRVVPPNPRGMILPPQDTPRRARGVTFTIYVFVDARGRVVPDSTRIIPSSGDRRWDRSAIERANQWRFDPARREGRPVAQWYPYEFEGT